MDFNKLVADQRAYFETGATRDAMFRVEALMKLKDAIYRYQDRLCEAMAADMNKCASEVFMTEIGIAVEELNYNMRHLKNWVRDKHVRTPLSIFPARSFISPEPYGVALIMSPWNYPILLTLQPLIGAIAAGCTAVVKPSAYSSNTSKVLAALLGEIYKPEYVCVVEGGRAENAALLDEKFDFIFFTGSSAVGRLVMEKAAVHLTPVTLELGGKSPVIVDKTADIAIAARRIAFGKVLNAGQTCVEPDYVFIHADVKNEFVRCFAEAIDMFFPDRKASLTNRYSDMNVIINEKHYSRVKALLESGVPVVGGRYDDRRRFIEPTLLDEVGIDSPIMQEEIFGPVLPMIEYTELDKCLSYIRNHPKPLALYLFTRDKDIVSEVLNTCSFGGGCINDTIIHLANLKLPFGGVGESGVGVYHGRKSFDTFTHYRSIVKKGFMSDIKLRYRPYTKYKDRLFRKFLK